MNELRKQRFGWYVYDWANSAFSTSVVTVFLGPFLTNVAESTANSAGQITPFGIPMHPGSWFSYCIAVSVILQVFILPPIGAIVDRSHRKRLALALCAFLGAGATIGLSVLSAGSGNYMIGGLFFIIANLSFGASVVVANSFLNDLATPEQRDNVSSRGWALGYLGGGLLLLAHLLWFSSAKDSGGSVEPVIQGVFITCGVWWALFTFVSIMLLRDKAPSLTTENHSLRKSFKQLFTTLRDLAKYPQTLRFFIAYLLYNDAIQTVIAMASVYGAEELGLGLDVLTQAILLVQFVAIGGSLAFAWLANRINTKRAIIVGLYGWCAVLIAAFFWVSTATHFFILAAVIAIV
ncbi:MAG: MFS transporter, partial [Candidatus Kapabacteria bacterium]|nr:MFS transporter [Candidatus Kapabacteria bacterium]